MSAETTLTAMASVLPTAAIQQTLVEAALDTLSGATPALILFCPETVEEKHATGKRREIHTVVALYLDRWDSNTRTAQELAADARANLGGMKANLRANRTLTVSGTDHALSAGEHIKTQRLGILEDVEGQRLPFPMYAAVLTIEQIADLWFTG